MQIKFNKYFVTNGVTKSRVHYSLDNRIDGKRCITIYAKDYDRSLSKIFDNYINDTDSQTDYFDKGRINLFENNPLYKIARERVEMFKQK